MIFGKVDAVVLFVQDLQKCVAFYRDQCGMEVVFTDEVSVAFKRDNQDFLLLEYAAAAEMVGDAMIGQRGAGHEVLLCADVDDVDAAYKTLTDKGVVFLKAPKDQPWGIHSAYFADPEGHLWELRKILSR